MSYKNVHSILYTSTLLLKIEECQFDIILKHLLSMYYYTENKIAVTFDTIVKESSRLIDKLDSTTLLFIKNKNSYKDKSCNKIKFPQKT